MMNEAWLYYLFEYISFSTETTVTWIRNFNENFWDKFNFRYSNILEGSTQV